MTTLSKDDIVSIITLKKRGESNRALARRFGVAENAIRYHLKRHVAGGGDRRGKTGLIERLGLAEAVAQWRERILEDLPVDRAPSGEALWSYLVEEHDYPGSQKSVRKYLRSHFSKPKLRPFRRVETPSGAQTQTDWVEFRQVDIGDPAGVNGGAISGHETGPHGRPWRSKIRPVVPV